jgi:hypothetical protein
MPRPIAPAPTIAAAILRLEMGNTSRVKWIGAST